MCQATPSLHLPALAVCRPPTTHARSSPPTQGIRMASSSLSIQTVQARHYEESTAHNEDEGATGDGWMPPCSTPQYAPSATTLCISSSPVTTAECAQQSTSTPKRCGATSFNHYNCYYDTTCPSQLLMAIFNESHNYAPCKSITHALASNQTSAGWNTISLMGSSSTSHSSNTATITVVA